MEVGAARSSLLGFASDQGQRESSTAIQTKGEVNMARANFTNMDEYNSAQPETAQVVLQLVRKALRKILPRTEEVISYKIPAYRLHGEIVLYFAGWKEHYSLYPPGDLLRPLEATRHLTKPRRVQPGSACLQMHHSFDHR